MRDHKPEGFLLQTGTATAVFFSSAKSLIAFLGEFTAAGWDAVCHPRKIRWRDTFYFMNRCGADGMPVTLLLCFLTGVILAYQSALQMHKYGADMFLPGLVGCTIVRELGPLMVAIVATGRSGSAFAAEIATMKISEELDAMTTMGLSASRFLVVPKLIAMMTMVPLLTVIGDAVGIFGGYLVGITELGMSAETYLRISQEWIAAKYFYEGVIKSFVFAWLITLAGCWCGFETGNDPLAVGQSTTRSVVIGILLVVLADAVLAKAFAAFYGMGG